MYSFQNLGLLHSGTLYIKKGKKILEVLLILFANNGLKIPLKKALRQLVWNMYQQILGEF